MKIERLRGTRDFAPEDMRKRRDLEMKMREVFESFGYGEVQTPTIEPLELFLLKSGQGVIDETYNFEDRGDRKICLVPERTAPTMRFYVNELQRREKPLKLYYFENCFRYENPQRGRYREFWQFGAELMGINDRAKANAELIAMALGVIEKSGIETRVRVGNLDLLKKALGKCVNEEEMPLILRAVDKGDGDFLIKKVDREVLSLLNCRSVEDICGCNEEKALLKEIFSHLKSYGVEAELDLSIARGLDYYYGVVFEIDCPSLGAEKQVAGGGEYSLIDLFGGRESGSSGFAIGFDRILDAQDREEEHERRGYYIIPVSDKNYGYAITIARFLRAENIKCEMELSRRSVEKSMKHADSAGRKFVVVVGDREERGRTLSLKNLDTGDQKEIDLESLKSIEPI